MLIVSVLQMECNVPIKLVFTDDEEVTQEVIKSTNRQTPIDENDLVALTKFQRDLEDYYVGFSDEKRLLYFHYEAVERQTKPLQINPLWRQIVKILSKMSQRNWVKSKHLRITFIRSLVN